MTVYDDDVKSAAEFLDKYCDNKAWRDKINKAMLDLEHYENCILGQIYGQYGMGIESLRTATNDEFCDLSKAFNYNIYREAWIKYLSSETLIGTKWIWHSCDYDMATETYTYKDRVVIDGTAYVIYIYDDNADDVNIRTEESFNQKFKRAPEKPVYVDGRIYVSATGKRVFIYDAVTRGGEFIFINTEHPSFSVDAVESNYGPLREFVYNNKSYTVTTV